MQSEDILQRSQELFDAGKLTESGRLIREYQKTPEGQEKMRRYSQNLAAEHEAKRLKKISLPRPEDWQHRPGSPGYFVTKDGRFQMLMTPRSGKFVLCTNSETPGKGFQVLRGPVEDPEQLGIPAKLVEESEQMTVDALIAQMTAGRKVTVQIGGALRKSPVNPSKGGR